ncbi:MAG: hypothetical protein ACPGJV_16395, partial [Bacteriovoracaceae bacterium]
AQNKNNKKIKELEDERDKLQREIDENRIPNAIQAREALFEILPKKDAQDLKRINRFIDVLVEEEANGLNAEGNTLLYFTVFHPSKDRFAANLLKLKLEYSKDDALAFINTDKPQGFIDQALLLLTWAPESLKEIEKAIKLFQAQSYDLDTQNSILMDVALSQANPKFALFLLNYDYEINFEIISELADRENEKALIKLFENKDFYQKIKEEDLQIQNLKLYARSPKLAGFLALLTKYEAEEQGEQEDSLLEADAVSERGKE